MFSVNSALLVRAAVGLHCCHVSCCVWVGRVPTQAIAFGVSIQIWLVRGYNLAVNYQQEQGS